MRVVAISNYINATLENGGHVYLKHYNYLRINYMNVPYECGCHNQLHQYYFRECWPCLFKNIIIT